MAELPDDVTEDILTCLPVKTLLCFRSVSKHFCTLIDGPDFIKRHLNRSHETKTNHKLVIGGKGYWLRRPYAHLYLVDLYERDQTVELGHPCGTKILGSDNGILCLQNAEKDIVFWNLATQRYHELPVTEVEFSGPPGVLSAIMFIVYGFGYDSVSDDYKLLRLIQFHGHDADSFYSEAKVYSLRLNSWQRIQDFPYFLSYERRYGKLACGALHWVVSPKPRTDMTNLIAAFDLAKNEYRLVDYPEFLEKGLFSVGHLERRLCVTWLELFERVDVWVMKDYGVKDSWSKLFTVSLAQTEELQKFVLVHPLAYLNSGNEIMWLQEDRQVFLYTMEEGRVDKVHVHGCADDFQSELCVESLIPLSGKAEDYANKMGGKVVKEKQMKGAKKRDYSDLISGIQVETLEKGSNLRTYTCHKGVRLRFGLDFIQ